MNEIKFDKTTLSKQLKTLIGVDFRRLFTSPLFYIMMGIALIMPILILVMTEMMDGMVTVDPNGNETIIKGFDNVWQIIGSKSDAQGAGGGLDMMTMCNINLLYFALAVIVCLFVTDDFRCGYVKNLFTVRSSKCDYVISKTLIGFFSGACMIILFFAGSMLGGAISGVGFDMDGVVGSQIFMSLMAKIFLMIVFSSIFVLMSVIAKQRAWLALVGSLGIGMLLFMMIPVISPLDAGAIHVILSLVGGVVFGVGMGAISTTVLRKTSLI